MSVTLQRHPIFDELERSLASVLDAQSVVFEGSWQPKTRRSYERVEQAGSGEGPFIDVIDWRWRGTVSSPASISAVAFMAIGGECWWSKSKPPQQSLDVELSLHTYADHLQDRATFNASIGGAFLPGIPVSWKGEPAAACRVSDEPLTVGRVVRLAETDEAAFAALILPGEMVTTGRHRLWRIRDRIAAELPAATRELLTRRRSGTLRAAD